MAAFHSPELPDREFSQGLDRFLEEMLNCGRAMELKQTQLLHLTDWTVLDFNPVVTYVANVIHLFWVCFLILKAGIVKPNLKYIMLKEITDAKHKAQCWAQSCLE